MEIVTITKLTEDERKKEDENKKKAYWYRQHSSSLRDEQEGVRMTFEGQQDE